MPAHAVDLIVLAEASGRTLAFGPGHVSSTASPGAPGTMLLTGHRDTHFRFLQEVTVGERLEVVGRDGRRDYYRVTDRR
ncbi:MAG: sortase family protein, Peptidase C60 [Nitrospira sp. OLB3]|nr:MAG: sortase family protein, Peptidase C60 [Nitrospira sp. OLB3]